MPRHRNRISWAAVEDLLTTPIADLQIRLGCTRYQISQARVRRRRQLGIAPTRGWRRGRQVGVSEERARSVPRGTPCECCGDPATDRFQGRYLCGPCLLAAGDAIHADLLSVASMRVAAAAIVKRSWHALCDY